MNHEPDVIAIPFTMGEWRLIQELLAEEPGTDELRGIITGALRMACSPIGDQPHRAAGRIA